jgi:hypothetical protein
VENLNPSSTECGFNSEVFQIRPIAAFNKTLRVDARLATINSSNLVSSHARRATRPWAHQPARRGVQSLTTPAAWQLYATQNPSKRQSPNSSARRRFRPAHPPGQLLVLAIRQHQLRLRSVCSSHAPILQFSSKFKAWDASAERLLRLHRRP